MSWQLDKQHSHIEFSVRHMMISRVRGAFTEFGGTVNLSDDNDFSTLQIQGNVQVNSIHTKETDRDNHLQSADFFDAEAHPQITFSSTSIAVAGSNATVTGDLTIKGKTNPVTLKGTVDGPAKDPWGNMRIGVSLSGTVNREDFDLTWNQVLETGGIMVGKEVTIGVDLQAVQQQDG